MSVFVVCLCSCFVCLRCLVGVLVCVCVDWFYCFVCVVCGLFYCLCVVCVCVCLRACGLFWLVALCGCFLCVNCLIV